VLDHPDAAGWPAARALEDGEVDPSDACTAEPLEHPVGLWCAIDHQHDRAAGPPQLDTGCDLHAPGGRTLERQPGQQHDHRDRRRTRAGEPPPPERACRGDRPDRDAETDEMAQADLAERQRGRRAGHPRDPSDQQVRGHVQEAGPRTAEEPGRHAPDHPPSHDDPGGRPGEQVGRDRRDRHATEGRDEERRDGELGPRGDRERLDQQRRARQRPPQPRRDQQDAGRCRHRELEAHRADEQRVDEDQPADRQRQVAQRGGRPPADEGDGRQRGHRRGAQHRRLPPCHQREEGEGGEREPAPREERQPAQQRRRHRQDEGDVLTAHREQMGEARAAEVVRDGRRLVAIVAEDEAGEQRTAVGWQRRGAVDEEAPHAVGCPPRRRTRAGVGHRTCVDAADQVAHLHPRRVVRSRGDLAFDPDPLAGEPRPQGAGAGPSRPQLVAVTVGPHIGDRRAEVVLGVGHERDRPGERPGPRRPEPVDRARGQPTGEQRGRDEQQPRAAGGERDDEHADAQGERQRLRHRRRRPGDRREQDRLPVAQRGASCGRRRQTDGPRRARGHTVTRSLISANLASPMTRTSSNWSTEVKGPCSDR
jgi:hypothetical protein